MSGAVRFTVSPEVFARRPDYIVGCVAAFGVDNRQQLDAVAARLTDAEDAARAALAGADAKSLPDVAIWRTVFGEQGWSPSKYLASIEALLKRVGKGDELPRINPIVDLGNAIALRFRVPIGAHDLAQLGADALEVRPATTADVFQPMGDAPVETPDAGEIVYAAGLRVRTRRWVWRQAADALVTPDTRAVFYPIDGFSDVNDVSVNDAVAALADACARLLGARVVTGCVTRETPEFSATP